MRDRDRRHDVFGRVIFLNLSREYIIERWVAGRDGPYHSRESRSCHILAAHGTATIVLDRFKGQGVLTSRDWVGVSKRQFLDQRSGLVCTPITV